VSQSALEHFDDDLTAFEDIAAFTCEPPRPLLQIHLVPAASALVLYPWHGVRQYTPRTLSKAVRLFAPYSHCVLFALGGRASHAIHWDFITRSQFFGGPERRQTEPERYAEAARRALGQDLAGDSASRNAAFYAFAVHSHRRERVFDPATDGLTSSS
jgi:hypothetical protein